MAAAKKQLAKTKGSKALARKPNQPPTPPRKPTAREVEQREALRLKNSERPERPLSKLVIEDGRLSITPADDQDEKLYGAAIMEAFGTRSLPFLNHTLSQICGVMAPKDMKDLTQVEHDAALAVVAAVEPENELEATIAAQMVVANLCAMKCSKRMVTADYLPQFQTYGNLANKFMRTFTAQAEALAKLRRKGEQIVKHVHVHEGGQAVVAGTINQGVRGSAENIEQCHGAEAAGGCASLPSPD